jgi:hypothetical protein
MLAPFIPLYRDPQTCVQLVAFEAQNFDVMEIFPELCRHHLTEPCVSLSVDNTGSHTLHSRAETTPSSPTNNPGNGHPEYIAYVLVPVFFVMGLLGVLICHLLKKKGYRCTTEAEQEVEEEKVEKIGK